MREDNQNATISMAEDTMAAYGTVDATIKELADMHEQAGDNAKQVTDVEVLHHVKSALSGTNWTDAALLDLIRFRAALTPALSEVCRDKRMIN